jgi:hypothetical protein
VLNKRPAAACSAGTPAGRDAFGGCTGAAYVGSDQHRVRVRRSEHDGVRDDGTVAVYVAVRRRARDLVRVRRLRASCGRVLDGERGASGSRDHSELRTLVPRRIAGFAADVAHECGRVIGRDVHLAVERVDFQLTDALRRSGINLVDASGIFLEARRIKQPPKIAMMREAVVLSMVTWFVSILTRSATAGTRSISLAPSCAATSTRRPSSSSCTRERSTSCSTMRRS